MQSTVTTLGCLAVSIACLSSNSAKAAVPVGTSIENFTLSDYRGREYSLEEFAEADVVIVAFLGTECPLVKLYGPRLQQIADEYADRGVVVVGINANVHDSVTEIDSFCRRHEISFPMLKDVGNVVADQFRAERTPQIFVLDSERNVRYHGRVDDQYVVGLVRDRADREDLRIAIDELLAGDEVSVPVTTPLGCIIGRVRETDANPTVTYSRDVAPLLHRRCVECHREGEIAPFTLTNYHEVAGWGEMIAEVVEDQRMPPWHANPEHGHFSNDRSLTAEEKELILTWVAEGCPEGNPADMPPLPEFTEGWQLPGEPDEIFAMADTPFQVPAEGGPEGVAYQHFTIDPGFTEDKWVVAAEVQPGNRAVVHHIIVYVQPPDSNRRNDIFFTAYVPGARWRPLPEGAAKLIPAGSRFTFQVHYTPVGTPQEDVCRVGFIYCDESEVEYEIHTTEVANGRFVLEPFKKDQEVTAQSAAHGGDLTLMSMAPHMHVRGQSFRYEAQYPDGTTEVLLDIPHYDFNWQSAYQLAEPKVMPAGTRMFCTALFDNSESNLANPDPSSEVRWGDQTWDEMMIGYFDVLTPHVRGETASADPGGPLAVAADAIINELDSNEDGLISPDEAAPRPIVANAFDRIDGNSDGQLDRDEVIRALRRLRERSE